jgi:hypothetical protein
MRPTRSLILFSIVFLAGCATTTSDVGQVREVAPGTYKIGVGGGAGSVVFGSHEAADAAALRLLSAIRLCPELSLLLLWDVQP